MKLSKERVSQMAAEVMSRLLEAGYLDLLSEKKAAVQALDRVITEELLVEDRLNAEVRQLMNAYATEIERGDVDYNKVFSMIKAKLAKDRELIL
ncbi:MAG: DUF507 family protein [Nitrospirales bacterium]